MWDRQAHGGSSGGNGGQHLDAEPAFLSLHRQRSRRSSALYRATSRTQPAGSRSRSDAFTAGLGANLSCDSVTPLLHTTGAGLVEDHYQRLFARRHDSRALAELTAAPGVFASAARARGQSRLAAQIHSLLRIRAGRQCPQTDGISYSPTVPKEMERFVSGDLERNTRYQLS